MSPVAELAPAKLNLALHVRGRLPDGRHAIETVFAFCTDGDRVAAEPGEGLSLTFDGPFGCELEGDDRNLVIDAATELSGAAGVPANAALHLTKNLPVASGIGGGSADAAATLRLLTQLWRIDPAHASAVAHLLGSDVPACLLSMTARGNGAGDQLRLIEDDAGLANTPVLLVNPGVPLSTREVFAKWDGVDRGPLGDWREGRNDLEQAARLLVPAIGDVLEWLRGQRGASFARMSGSGATCFALFADEASCDAAAAKVPGGWWRLATTLR